MKYLKLLPVQLSVLLVCATFWVKCGPAPSPLNKTTVLDSSSPQLSLKQDIELPSRLSPEDIPFFFKGASLSNGFGASFSLKHRLIALFDQNRKDLLLAKHVLGDKKVLILFDYFYITNFPHWSNFSDGLREAKVKEALNSFEKEYDYILFSLLPSKEGIYADKSYSKQEWQKKLSIRDRSQINTIMSDTWLTRIYNPFPERVRDEINRVVLNRARQNPNKYHRFYVEPFLQDLVRNGFGITEKGVQVPLSNMFSDFVHFNDVGQSIMINSLLIPSMTNFIAFIAPEGKTFSPDLTVETPAFNYNQQWVDRNSRSIFGTVSEFEAREPLEYQLRFKDPGAFVKNPEFKIGQDRSKNPFLSAFRLQHPLAFRIGFEAENFGLSIPIRIKKSGKIILDMAKPIQAGTTELVNPDPNNQNVYVGFMFDYWTTQLELITNYKFELRKVENKTNTYIFKWYILPLLPGQEIVKERVNLKPKDQRSLKENWDDMHKLIYTGEVYFN